MGYTEKELRSMFRSQCFNNACVIFSGAGKMPQDLDLIFQLAEELYQEGMNRNWQNYGESKSSSQEITHKEGRELDKDTKTKPKMEV